MKPDAPGAAGARPGPWIGPFVPALGLLVVLMLARVVLILSYPSDFAGLSGGQVLGAFAAGLRFDLAVTAQLVGIPLALALLPAAFARGKAWQSFAGWLAFVGLLGGLLLTVGDLVYFPDVRRHIGGDLANSWGSDWNTLLKSLFDFPLALAAFIVVLGVVAFGWARLLARPGPEIGATRASWLRYAAFVVVLGVVAKGFHRGDFLPVHAFTRGSVPAGYLTLNGPFSALHSIDDRRPMVFEGDLDDAVTEFRSRFTLTREVWAGDRAPLQRDPAPRDRSTRDTIPGRPNIVILVLESFDAIVTDALRARAGLDPLGATPVFDGLVPEGTLYTRFYANGQRSLEGLTAMLASFPTLPGIPYLGDGTAGVEKSFLGHMAGDLGYATHMV
ncbi:MAG: hypothetical protein OEU54_09310, partial [Gemmatimonadota bacterium]|nr:hypothetical protein [Gemmatimonadota bacterium]